LNILPWGDRLNAFSGVTLTGADFSNVTWGASTAAASTGLDQFFSGGSGATSAATKDSAVTFEGADLSLITGDAKTNMIANLGAFDGVTAIGPKFDDAMITNSTGWTQAELITAGWQYTGTNETLAYDLSTSETVTLDLSTEVLTNASGLSTWDATGLQIADGSNLTGLDMGELGVTAWTPTTFTTTEVTRFDGANLSGMTLNLEVHNFGYNDSFVGADFSNSTINTGDGYNQLFLFSDLTNADFSGATLDIAASGVRMNAFREAVLTGADFSNITWGISTAAATDNLHQFFSGGSGATTRKNRHRAVTFEGADLSLITGDAKTNMIANLGGFDGSTPIGAKFDAAMLANSSGWTLSELIDAGWQLVHGKLKIRHISGNQAQLDCSDLPAEGLITIQFTESLIDSDWVDIGTVQSGSTSYTWDVEDESRVGFYRLKIE